MLDCRLRGSDTLGFASRGETGCFIRLRCYPLVKISYSEKLGEKPGRSSPAARNLPEVSRWTFATRRHHRTNRI